MIERSTSGALVSASDSAASQALILMVLSALIWLAYRVGLNGPFIFDDIPNFISNPSIAIDSLSSSNLAQAAYSKSDGGLGRPVPMLSFALNYYFAGKVFDSFPFKLTNLVVHIANVVLVFLLTRALFSSAAMVRALGDSSLARRQAILIAALAAGLWGLHPIQLTSVLYTVQRMTSMSAFFVLGGLIFFIHGRTMLAGRPLRGLAFMAGGLAGGVSLGYLCKENSVLLPIFVILVEFIFFETGDLSISVKRKLAAFYLLTVGAPMLLGCVYVLLNPDFLPNSYSTRDFGMTERVLTESRVLFFYLSLIAFPVISRFSLYHDSFQLSTGLLDPWTTLVALAAWLLIAIALIGGLRRRAVWAFGLAWYLGGHALESSVLGLELIHEHRNYVPSVGILAAAAFYLVRLFERLRSDRRVFALSGLCVLLVFGFVTHTRAELWSTRSSLFEFLVRHDPGSYRALAGLASGMIGEKRDARVIYKLMRNAAIANPGSVYPLIWMERVLQALIVVSSDENSNAGKPPETTAQSRSWVADPVLEIDQLLMIDQALSEEIRKRLVEKAVHMETVHALSTTASCLLTGGFECTPLRDRLLNWHLLALEKLPQRDKRRAILELSVATLYAERGELDLALGFVERAISTSGGSSEYLLHKGFLLARLGRVDEAIRIADEVERGIDWRRRHAQGLEILRFEIQMVEEQRASGSSGANGDALPTN